MVDVAHDAAATSTGRRTVAARLLTRLPDRRWSAAGLVGVYVVLLFGVPARLIVPQIGAPGTPANLWAVGLLLWWICARIAGLQRPVGPAPVRLAMGAVLACVLISYAAAMTSGWYAPPNVRGATDLVYDLVPASVGEIRGAMVSAADRGLISFAGWLGIVLVTIDGIRTWADLDRVMKMISYLGVFVAVLGIVQYLTGFDISTVYRIPGLAPNSAFGAVDARSISLLRRVQGTATGAIEYGVVLAGVFPIALHRAMYDPRPTLWRFAPPILIAYASALSISRSAVLVAGFAGITMFIGWPRERRRVALYAVPAGIIVTRLLAPGVVGTLRSLFLSVGQDNSITGRTEDYDIVFRIYSEHPVAGRGLFTFVPRYYRILDNQILMFLLELGALGTLAFFTLITTAFRSARWTHRRAFDDEHRHLGLALSGSLLGVFVSFATFDALTFPMAAGVFFLLIGLCGASRQLAGNDARDA